MSKKSEHGYNPDFYKNLNAQLKRIIDNFDKILPPDTPYNAPEKNWVKKISIPDNTYITRKIKYHLAEAEKENPQN